MTLVRMIAPQWLLDATPGIAKVIEGQFSTKFIHDKNSEGYNVYTWPNHPSSYQKGSHVDASQVDVFNYVFVDYDSKSANYLSKDAFIAEALDKCLEPSRIVDSGNGVHIYWRVSDLDALSFLRLSRRLMRMLKTDDAVQTLCQLMRLPNTLNTKVKDSILPCELLIETDRVYTCEELHKSLPPISEDDERYCKTHYDRAMGINQDTVKVDEKLPAKFGTLLAQNDEVKAIYAGSTSDRSKDDYRLGHILWANKFTTDEAMSVLVNTAKALSRAPQHRINYAKNIIDKVGVFEKAPLATKKLMAKSVASLVASTDSEELKGKRFPCYNFFDGSEHGFRLGQVIGLCAGVGVGKTAIGLNMFMGFVRQNPDFVHLFVSLEQPAREIAGRWQKMTAGDSTLNDKVHVLDNYNDDDTFRNLSLKEIEAYVHQFNTDNAPLRIGCVCIDHIGILRQDKKPGEHQGLRDICSQMKPFALSTKTLLVMQTQTNREKAGIGDLELHKDAAYGTQSFESYVDYMMVLWQPLKRCYDNPQCPRVTAYKFAKVRFKSRNDTLLEDMCYRLLFDQDTETLKPMTQDDEKSFDYFALQAVNLRKKDRKTDLVTYKSVRWDVEGGASVVTTEVESDKNSTRH